MAIDLYLFTTIFHMPKQKIYEIQLLSLLILWLFIFTYLQQFLPRLRNKYIRVVKRKRYIDSRNSKPILLYGQIG